MLLILADNIALTTARGAAAAVARARVSARAARAPESGDSG